MKYTYHHLLSSEFRDSLKSLIGSKFTRIAGQQLHIGIGMDLDKSVGGGIAGYENLNYLYFELSENVYATITLSTENYEAITGETVVYFSQCILKNEHLGVSDYSSNFDFEFFINSIEIYGKEIVGEYTYYENYDSTNQPEYMDFDILTDSLIIFQDEKANFFYISSDGTGSIGFGICGEKYFNELTSQKYIDSEEYILKKHLTISN